MSLQVWLPLNGSLENQGLCNVTITNNGATVNNNGKIGKCYSLSGSSQKITATFPISVSSAIGSLSCWVKFNALPSSSAWFNLMQVGASGGFAACRLGMYFEYGSGINISINGSSTGANYKAYTFTTGVWYHICAIYDGTNVKLYINGIEQLNKTASVGSYTTAATTLFMGGTSSYYLNGYLNDCRYYDHALSAKEVEELSRGLVLHYKLDGKNEIIVPNEYQQLEYIESAGAAWLNTGYTFNPETDSFNVVFKGNDTSNNGMIFASNGSKYSWLYYYSAGMRIYITNSSGTQQSVSGPSRDTNKHTAIYNNKHYYLDGTDRGALSGSYTSDTNPIYLFAYTGSGTNYAFKGRIYYVEIARDNNIQKIFIPVKRLSDNAIGMYEIYSNNFIPSMTSTPFTAGPVISIDANIYDTSGYQHNGTINSSIYIINNTARYNNSTIFNSNTISLSPIFFDDTNQCHTVSAWVYPTANSDATLINFNSGYKLFHSSTGKTLMYLNSGTNDSYVYGIALPLNEWTLVTWVLNTSNQTCKVYYNGTLNATSGNYTSSDVPSGVNKNLIIGSGFAGYISDLRIYATVLTDAQIKELYNTSVTIDNLGNIYSREYVEDDNNLNVTKTGLFESNIIHDDNDLTIASILKTEKQIQGNTLYEY